MMEDGAIREAQPTGEFEEASTPKLQDRIEKATQDQDRQLDAIHSGVQRLHHAAKATNEEVISQNAMLDQVSVQISDTQVAVQQQTKAAKKVVRAHRKVCWYWVIILLLIIALLIIIFI
ncbi:Ubiquitin extension protein [Phytophthora megakarya]|uniref:Ubiquitin extension protein n=1 Tax=Phytophthora megakarya TaxID=4795 RepID=A0A225VHU0_9STRA|nr:Ubiquitin extension protein [Phytophthora megakarya]